MDNLHFTLLKHPEYLGFSIETTLPIVSIEEDFKGPRTIKNGVRSCLAISVFYKLSLFTQSITMHAPTFLVLLAFFVHQPVTGWGDVGHRTIAYLAEKYLSDHGSQLVNKLLENNRSYDISDAATWADYIKPRRPYTRPWHYIGKNLWQAYYICLSHI
jgi:hypothetical protein